MNQELSRILSLRKVFGLVKEGSGVSQAVVRVLSTGDSKGREAARKVLLGHGLAFSLSGLTERKSDESGMLTALVVESANSSSGLMGAAGEGLSLTLERWLKAKENSRMEERVQRFRGVLASAVLGAVMGMVSTVGPLVGSLNFAGPAGGFRSENLLLAAIGLTCYSSAMLGLFMSGKRFIVNVVVSLLAFSLVATLAAPLGSIQPASLWGIK